MEIKKNEIRDVNEILRIYKIATGLQIAKSVVPWPEFDRKLIESEIVEHQQWKIVINVRVACVWATTFNDPQIWGERNEDPSTYI